MEVTEKKMPKQAQLLYLGHKDTSHLLEVYVKRSISLNDGTCEDQRSPTKPRKWVTLSEKHRRVHRHSIDSLVTFGPSKLDEGNATSTPPDEGNATSTPPDEGFAIPNAAPVEIPGPADILEIEASTELENKFKEGKKKSKKTSLWKGFLGFFSRKGSDKKDEHESGTETGRQTQGNVPKNKSIKKQWSSMRRRPLRKIKSDSLRGSVRRSSARNRTNTTEITGVESVVSVGLTDSYYEKVSEELEKIVSEEKDTASTDEDVIKRIIVLMKQQGDVIDNKLKENPSLSAFFQKLSYSTFQQLADTYVETETPTGQSRQTPHTAGPGPGPVNAPELVKLAFTLDFTARVACLSRQSTGHIMGLGNRYLEDRFTQTPEVNPDQTLHN
ncbi:hypothetical protein J4Q44_G00100380 [Coregonus suidteri]|uniref:Apoptosis facilitator Bcl-2-like protein 14 n=1 Tax=Coregonus suidteri TaxID=861788 RepID=A0AAN8M0H3_9TELE